MQCRYFGKCGGCVYIDRPYAEQLRIKQDKVSGCLKKAAANGTCKGFKIENIIGADDPYHYRNKVHSVFSRDRKGNVTRGMYREDSHEVVNVSGCLLEDETADAIIEEIKRLVPSFKMKIYDEDRGTGFLRHVLVRVAKRHESNKIPREDGLNRNNSQNISNREKSDKKEYMVILVTGEVQFNGKNNFIKALRSKFPQITTIVQNINNKRTSMILGDRSIILYGSGYVVDDSLGFGFRISPSSFFQINTAQTRKLYDLVLEMANPTASDTVLDAYCGTGTIGMFLSSEAGHVTGVELNPDAVKDARDNAKRNKIDNISFICADATKYMQELALNLQKPALMNDGAGKSSADKIRKSNKEFTILCMDPPRSGSTPEFINAAAELKIPRIVYVSCNPETLGRDLELFVAKGYIIKRAVPVDMFPFTGHVESIALLQRMSNTRSKEITLDVDMEDYHRIKSEGR